MSTIESPGSVGPVGHGGARVDIAQRTAIAVTGWLGVVALAGCLEGILRAGKDDPGLLWLPIVVAALVLTSLVIVPPGQTSVIQFFGRYVGTISRAGFHWTVPFSNKHAISLRVTSFPHGP